MFWSYEGRTERVSSGREVVIDDKGNLDLAATVYRFGDDMDRIQLCRAWISSARKMIDTAKQLAARSASGDVVNQLRRDADTLLEKAVWMCPNDTIIHVRGMGYYLQDIDGSWWSGRPAVYGVEEVTEFNWNDIEDMQLG